MSLLYLGVKPPYRKKKIPSALRNQVWISRIGEKFRVKCSTTWCRNIITPFTFEAGHNIPESKGGSMTLENLIPICSSCNKSMGNTHTFDQWCKTYTEISMYSVLSSVGSPESPGSTESTESPESPGSTNQVCSKTEIQPSLYVKEIPDVPVTCSKKGILRLIFCY
jgi:hypothetical protein